MEEAAELVLQHLTYLAALAHERHFGRAAQACNVTQATLSAAIRRLEAELGAPLVQRGNRFQGLTAEGERAVEWAHRILGDIDGMVSELAAMRSGLSGRVRIGAIPTSLPMVALLTDPLRRRHGQLTVLVSSMTSRQIERGLQDSELDVGLTYLQNEPLRGVRSLPLYHERYVFVTMDDGPFADREAITWADAATVALCLLSPDMQNRRTLDRIFDAAGVAPHPEVETNSISTLYGHVRDGRMSTVMAHTWLHLFPLAPGMRAIALGEPEVTQSVGLVWLDRDPEPLLAQAVIEVARGTDVEAALRR